MNALDKVRALFVAGEEVECVENTYIPDRTGLRRVVSVGRSVVECEADGKPYRMELPTRVRDVVSVDSQQATWNLQGYKGPARLAGHTVTIRRVVLPHTERTQARLQAGKRQEAIDEHNKRVESELARAKQGATINLSDLMAAKEELHLDEGPR